MNWRKFLLFSVLSLSAYSFAQSNLLNAKKPEEIGKKTEAEKKEQNDKPLPYGYIADRDILMSKTHWEVIDLNQRVNFPMYYPSDDAYEDPETKKVVYPLGDERKPLFSVLMDAIKDKKITEVYDSGYFTKKKTYEEIIGSMAKIDTLTEGYNQINAGSKVVDPQYITKTEIKAGNINAYQIKGTWYFDKRQGELKYRLIGIAPMSEDVTQINNTEKQTQEVFPLFWIFFPDARETLHNAKAFNEKNSAMPFSFDHLLNSRRFSATIFLEENGYGDRKIEDYMKENAQMQLLESERVKEKVRNFELDMWNY